MRGVADGLAQTGASFTSPNNLMLLATGGLLSRLGKLGTVLLSAPFEAQAIKQAPEQWQTFKTQMANGDVKGAAETGTSLVASLGIPAAAVALHAATRPVESPEGAPATTEQPSTGARRFFNLNPEGQQIFDRIVAKYDALVPKGDLVQNHPELAAARERELNEALISTTTAGGEPRHEGAKLPPAVTQDTISIGRDESGLPASEIQTGDQGNASRQGQAQLVASENAPAAVAVTAGAETSSPESELISNLNGEKPSARTLGEKASSAVEGIKQAARDAIEEGQKQGIVAPGTAQLVEAQQGAADIFRQIRGVPKFGDFERAINSFGSKLQRSYLDSTALAKSVKRLVPDKLQRQAVFTYMDAGGDATKLADWAAKADPKEFPEYEAALNLRPEQTKLADQLSNFFDQKGKQGQDAGVLRNFREDYINRIVDRRKTARAGGNAAVPDVGLAGSRLSKSFKFARQRVFDSAFDAEQAGVRYATKDPAELVPIYLNEMNKTIASRELVADLAHGRASDSRALAYPMGIARKVGAEEAPTTTIKPNFKQRVADEITGDDVSSADYVASQHPALSKFKWVETDSNGNPIMMEGQLALHPDIARHVNNIFGSSAIRRWYNSQGSALAALPKAVVRTLDNLNQGAKSYLFSGSGFHHVTMAKKGFDIGAKPIRNFFKTLPQSAALQSADPRVRFWTEHGSQLAPDYLSASRFMEGFGGRGPERVPLYGRWVKALSSHLFERFIPGMKLTLNEMYLEKNNAVFAKELAANEVTPDQMAYLSARQANEALSHINYVDIGRNPTLQHIFSLGELAPDFLESRTRFTARAVAGALGAKQGRLALRGFVWGLAHTWLAARIVNKLIDDDYHFDEPFGVVHNGRVYSLRTVYGDALQMMAGVADLLHGDFSGEHLARFLQSRESPLAKIATMILTGVNYRGEKTSSIEAMREFVGTYVPIWAKAIPGLRNITETAKNNPVSPLEQVLGAWGFHQRRYSPISKTYSLANDYKTAAGIPKDTGTYPVSKYQQLRYALEDGDMEKAKSEYQKLRDSGMKGPKIRSGFRESLFHPFTGSKKSDHDFKKSLSPEDLATFEAAQQKRHEVMRLFGEIPR
jgi:hypothetical protein